MIRVPHLALVACAGLAIASAWLVPLAVAQDVAPAVESAPRNSTPEELAAKTRYEATEYEVTVRPPIDAGNGVLAENVRYPSPFDSGFAERNDVVRGRLFRVEEPEKAAVIALGGWRFDPLTPELARDLARSGIQVLYIDIPFQGQRVPRGKKPGEMTLSDDLIQNEKVFVQLALDVERAVDWLVRERGVDKERVGILGTSLGGFAAATLYGMKPERFKAVAVQLAGADVAKVLFNGNWLTRGIQSGLIEQGLSEIDVRTRVAAMSPGTWAKSKRKDGVLLIAAELDEIVPLHTVEDLKDRYGGARMIVIPDAPHRTAEGLRSSLPEVRKHFEKQLGVKTTKSADEQPSSED